MTMLDSLITSKTRLKLLLKFFSDKYRKGYLRSLAEEFGESINVVRVELNRLSRAGFLESGSQGNAIVYKAKKKHPLFPDITGIVSKYLGLDNLVEQVILHLGQLDQAWVVGDYAEGRDSWLIDLVLVGDVDRTYLNMLIARAETLINRKIRTLVLRAEELPFYKKKLQLNRSIILFAKET
jgi:hypothetical protein